MKILEKHIKNEYRFKKGDLWLREPNDLEREEIKGILGDKIQLNEDYSLKSASVNLRHFYRNYTSIGNEIDEITDEDFANLINNDNSKFDRDVKLLNDAIVDLIEEVSEDMLIESTRKIKAIGSMLDAVNSGAEIAKIEEKIFKIFKKQKINITLEEIHENILNPEGFATLMDKVQSNKKTSKKSKKK